MDSGDKGPPKYVRVAAAVRGQIADGTLRPGQPAPSGAALGRVTGYSTLTCRRALRVLIADGVLIPGPSRNARPRVAGGPQALAERDLAAAGRALSAGLAARRRANGLTQPELAVLAGISVTTVGHAETGRLWQSRQFWERADAVLGAGGELLRLHDAYREAGAEEREPRRPQGAAGERASATDDGAPPGEPGRPAAARPGTQPVPACVTIVWGDGSVTTVHPPETSAAR
jgi:transcriptional regulator with XRE-family HTH domain